MADSFILIAKYYVTSRHQDLHLGAVHKVRHAMFGQFAPLLPVTLCHTSRDPPKVRHTSRTPIFSRPSTKIPDKSPLYKFYLNCSLRFLSGGFCPGWFLSVPPFCHNTSVTTES